MGNHWSRRAVRSRGRTAAVALAALLWLSGCGEKAKSAAELDQALTQAAADAQTACDATDAAAADRAAETATDLVAELTALAQPATANATADPAAQAALPAAQTTLAGVMELAALTHEKKLRDDRIHSLTLWTYRKGRNLAVQGVLHGMALAAGQAQAKGLSGLPKPAQNLAEQAAALADCPPLADGSPDWAAVQAKLNGWATTPPPELALILSIGWLTLRQNDLALAEIEMAGVPPAAATTPVSAAPPAAGNPPATAVPSQLDLQRVLMRALVYRENDMPRLAALEEAQFDRLTQAVGSSQGKETTEYLQLLLHSYRCSLALKQRDLTGADRELAELLRHSPDSPVTVLLTGERQAAAGNAGQAAQGLETWLVDHAKDPESAWWVATIQARARAVRDSAGDGQPAPPFLLDADFLLAVGEHLRGKPGPTGATAQASLGVSAVQAMNRGAALARDLQAPGAGGTEPASESTSATPLPPAQLPPDPAPPAAPPPPNAGD